MFCQVIGSSVLSVTQVPVSAVQGYLLWKHIFILIVFHIVQYTMISKNTRLYIRLRLIETNINFIFLP